MRHTEAKEKSIELQYIKPNTMVEFNGITGMVVKYGNDKAVIFNGKDPFPLAGTVKFIIKKK